MDENIPPPHKHTKCKMCGATDKPLFAMPVMEDKRDFFCKECKLKEVEKRAKEVKNG